MKLARLGESGSEIPVLVDGDRYLDLRGVIKDFSDMAGLERVRAAVASGSLPVLDGAGALRVGAPVLRPSAIICIGMNYAAHAAESGSAPPTAPILFLKTPNTVGGPNDDVAIPRKSHKTDWEVELAVLIGRKALYLDSPADSAAHVAGYLLANDVSEREFQIEISGGQWSKGKSAPGFSPLGPWLVTPDEVDPGNLRLRSWVNGEPRQDSTTADLIFDVDFIIWNLSQFMALEPGDVIMTGTPAGVALSGKFPYLRAGDVVELEIEGLGRQRQVYTQA
ncbi:fumarylacetoacetate hydrolase family protein [Glaciihabitans sp. dw_435]|uniref:fumarylacetoacetate hydrolase family protein n=1 Tax=Glaciihabitans sp. dw_435 TaxID=2720081 RepID=UPI001BD2BC97|nr:fumarylacetoacetate hydrolase family protein [Glaciihabitans sp. dw_435]